MRGFPQSLFEHPTVKMLGRIFEAQPPAEVDEYKDLANDVYKIAELSLNPHVITASQIAAKAQLAEHC